MPLPCVRGGEIGLHAAQEAAAETEMEDGMTPAEARERIESIRIELRKCMRTVSVPDVEWAETDAVLAHVQALVTDMRVQTLMKALEDK